MRAAGAWLRAPPPGILVTPHRLGGYPRLMALQRYADMCAFVRPADICAGVEAALQLTHDQVTGRWGGGGGVTCVECSPDGGASDQFCAGFVHGCCQPAGVSPGRGHVCAAGQRAASDAAAAAAGPGCSVMSGAPQDPVDAPRVAACRVLCVLWPFPAGAVPCCPLLCNPDLARCARLLILFSRSASKHFQISVGAETRGLHTWRCTRAARANVPFLGSIRAAMRAGWRGECGLGCLPVARRCQGVVQ